MTRALFALLVGPLLLSGCVDLSSLLSGSASGSARQADGADDADEERESDDTAGAPLPTAGTVGARVRNFTDLSADVTLRFSLNDVIVHLSFLRVPPRTSVTDIGPDLADRLEASGIDENGEPLPDVVFLFGVDFDEGTEAEYVIGGDLMPQNVPPSLRFVEPADDVQVARGDDLAVIIDDEDPDSAATISFFLDPDDQALSGDEYVLAIGVPEDPDDAADVLALTIPNGVARGLYRLIAVISDGFSTAIVPAAGRVEVIRSVGEEPEAVLTLALLEPAQDLEVVAGESFSVTWTDEVADANGTITLYLDPNEVALDGDERLLASGIAEDPDQDGDTTILSTANVLPGVYRVVGELAFGGQTVTARAPGRLIVLPEGDNALTILDPAVDVTVRLGELLFVSWLDVNHDRDAEITFYLDADTKNLNGGEIWIGAFAEDPDGPGLDDAHIPIINLPEGTYDLLGVMFDGLVATPARASGQVIVVGRSAGGQSSGTFPDCQPNGIPDDQELADNDCNTNGQPDDCDITDGTSTDENTNGVPDSCEPVELTYWRFNFHTDPACGDGDVFFPRVRYLAFDQFKRLRESWIVVDGGCVELDQVYFKINFPSTGGPSLTRYDDACQLTDGTDRVMTVEDFGSPTHTVHLEEVISLPTGGTGESGTLVLDGWITATTDDSTGAVLGVGMEGTWQFDTADGLICGYFVAERDVTPPELPCVVDVEPTALALDTVNLASPSTVAVTDREYRVRYSFLTEPIAVHYYLSAEPDPVVTGADVLLATDTIAPGPASTLGLHSGPGPALVIPPGLQPSCDYYLLIVVDADHALAETDEHNNVLTVPVTVSPDGLADCGTAELK